MLEPKNTVTKVKKLIGGLNNRMEMTDEIGSELEDRSVETLQSEEERGKDGMRRPEPHGPITESLTFMSLEFQRRRAPGRKECVKK